LPETDNEQDWKLKIQFQLDNKFLQNVIIRIYGCTSEDYCMSTNSIPLFTVEAKGSPLSLIRRLREDYMIGSTYFILSISSLLVLILTLCYKKCKFFNVFNQLLIFGASTIFLGTIIESFAHKEDDVMQYSALSAQLFSCVHIIFSLKYLQASITIPIKLQAEDNSEPRENFDVEAP